MSSNCCDICKHCESYWQCTTGSDGRNYCQSCWDNRPSDVHGHPDTAKDTIDISPSAFGGLRFEPHLSPGVIKSLETGPGKTHVLEISESCQPLSPEHAEAMRQMLSSMTNGSDWIILNPGMRVRTPYCVREKDGREIFFATNEEMLAYLRPNRTRCSDCGFYLGHSSTCQHSLLPVYCHSDGVCNGDAAASPAHLQPKACNSIAKSSDEVISRSRYAQVGAVDPCAVVEFDFLLPACLKKHRNALLPLASRFPSPNHEYANWDTFFVAVQDCVNKTGRAFLWLVENAWKQVVEVQMLHEDTAKLMTRTDNGDWATARIMARPLSDIYPAHQILEVVDDCQGKCGTATYHGADVSCCVKPPETLAATVTNGPTCLDEPDDVKDQAEEPKSDLLDSICDSADKPEEEKKINFREFL